MSFFSKIVDLFMQPKDFKKDKNDKRMNFDKFGSQYAELMEKAKELSKSLAKDIQKRCTIKRFFLFLKMN